jgi:DNA-binding transcriptional LysR family regulator
MVGRAVLQCVAMDIQQLRTFVEVVHRGSFAQAARRLDLAPSMVSRAVSALEAELGVRLLQRTSRQLSLSDAGSTFYEQVRGLLDQLERATDEVRHAHAKIQGTVRLTTTVAFGQALIVPLLPELHELHPGLEVELLLSDAVKDIVADRIDLAIRLGPPTDSSLIGYRLAQMRYHVCASPAYLERHGHPSTPSDLARHDCLRFPMPGFRTRWTFRDAAGSENAVDVKGWLVASSALALRQAALDGLGPVLLGHWLVDQDVSSGRMIDLFPDHEVTASSFDSAAWLLYPSRAYLPRRVRAVADFLKSRIGP